jgi:sulfite exporter TauE/SafE
MLASINPLGERSRNRTWWVTYSWFVAGSVVAGTLLGALLGGVGALVDAALGPSSTAVAIVALGLGAIALVFELHVGDLPLPTVRRQVDEDWIPRYRAWVYAGGFGFQLGLGVVTVVTTATVYLTWAFAVLTGSVVGGAMIGIVFGLGRALPVLLVARADTPGRLRSALQRFSHWAPAARRVATTVTALVPVLALALVVGGTG